jgi:hypothetical protein
MTRDFTAFERLMLPLVRRLVTWWVRPSVLPDDVRERLVAGRPIVFALEKRIGDLAVLGVRLPQRNPAAAAGPPRPGTPSVQCVFP